MSVLPHELLHAHQPVSVCTVCRYKEVRVDLEISDLNTTSNTGSVGNLIFGVGNPDKTWEPTSTDTTNVLQIALPDVNGKSAGHYEIMEVKFKQTGELGPVTMQIYDDDFTKVFQVR